MRTATTEIDLDLPFRFQVLGVKHYFELLLFPPRLNEQRITKIVIVEMERRFVVPISVSLDDLPIRNLGIFHQDISVRDPTPIRSTDKPFDRESMVRFMCGPHPRRGRRKQHSTGG